MSILAYDVLKVAVDVLNDDGSIRWTVPMLVRFLNAGQREIQVKRPDSTIFTTTQLLALGARQQLPDTSAKLLKVIRNTNGTKAGIRLTDQDVLDAFQPSWYSMTPAPSITDYMYDPRDPSVFYVYPPALPTVSIELSYSLKVVDITVPAEGSQLSSVTGNVNVRDTFANALSDYVLYRAFALDIEAGSQAKSANFYQLFRLALGEEASATMATSPSAAGPINNPKK